MSLIETIEHLDTRPLNQEYEYEYSSKFLEWFYMNMYREKAFSTHPVLYKVSQTPGYKGMTYLCGILINIQYAKCLTDETRKNIYNDMKQWLLNAIKQQTNPTS